jgi:DNA-binding Xre family transcriptional regulator
MTQRKRVELPSPTANVRHRVRELRARRRLSARELAELVQAHGVDMDRDVIANFESGRRQSLSVDELVVLALVLDVSPVDLLLRDDSGLQVGKWTVAPVAAAQWARGERALPSQDVDAWQAERSTVRSGPGRLLTPVELGRVLRDAGVELRFRNDIEGSV